MTFLSFSAVVIEPEDHRTETSQMKAPVFPVISTVVHIESIIHPETFQTFIKELGLVIRYRVIGSATLPNKLEARFLELVKASLGSQGSHRHGQEKGVQLVDPCHNAFWQQSIPVSYEIVFS